MNRHHLLLLALMAAPVFAAEPPAPFSASPSNTVSTNKPAKSPSESLSTTAIDPEARELKPHDTLRFLIEQDPAFVESQRNGGGADAEFISVTDGGEAIFHVSRSSPVSVKLNVAGKKLEAIRKDLKALLDADYYQDCSFRLDLLGVVRLPGQMDSVAKVVLYGDGGLSGTFPIPEGEPLMLSDVILRAGGGGGNNFANLKKVRVRRLDPETKKEKIIPVDVKKILESGDRTKDLELKDGDRVEVPDRNFVF
jgi:protein involved in polysaccharide export with SLBB domain